MKKKYAILAAVATMFAACTNEENLSVVDELTDTPVVVNAGVAELIARAGVTGDGLTSLGLFIDNAASTQYSYSNVRFEKSSGTVFTPVIPDGGKTPVWQNSTQAVTVTAYAPYCAAWTKGGTDRVTIAANQTTAETFQSNDIVWASAEVTPSGTTTGDGTTAAGSITASNGALNIHLKHVLSKLSVNVKYGSELDATTTTIADVTVKGLKLEGTIDLTDGEITEASEATATDITAYAETPASGYAGTYEAIFLPQTAKFEVLIGLGNGRTFAYEYTDGSGYTFESGKAYTLHLVVGKDKATIGQVTVAEWGTPTSILGDNQGETKEMYTFDKATNTYTVFNAEGLQMVNEDIAKNIKTKKNYNITLAADIDLPNPVAPETSNWTMLGYFDNSDYTDYFYEGTFDGAGHTIRNLQINNPTANEAALVYGLSNNGAVKNLTLENPVICSNNYAAGIVAYSSLDGPNASVTNCHIKGGSIKGAQEVGGIAGNYYGNIIACTVSETTIEGYAIGGIVGSMNFGGRIIACGVNEVKFIPSSNNASVGGIAGYLNAWSLDGEAIHIYSCYIKDCTTGTDLQALEGTANMTSAVRVYGDCSLTMYNCAYRTKDSSITYGVCGTESEQTDNDYTVDMFITETGMTSTDWSIAASDLNEGIRNWNEYNYSTLPCYWEWDTTEEGKLKVKQ